MVEHGDGDQSHSPHITQCSAGAGRVCQSVALMTIHNTDAAQYPHLVAPHAREYVVELHVYGTKRQEAGHHHLGQCTAVPGQLRDLSRVLVGPVDVSRV